MRNFFFFFLEFHLTSHGTYYIEIKSATLFFNLLVLHLNLDDNVITIKVYYCAEADAYYLQSYEL